MTSPVPSESVCPGCGLELEVVDGPTHDYSEYGMPEEHEFVVDAYAIQHPGENEPRARQSVGAHLIRLCLMLERDKPQRYATALMTRPTHGGLDALEAQLPDYSPEVD